MNKHEKHFWAVVATLIYGGMVVGTVLLWVGAWIASFIV